MILKNFYVLEGGDGIGTTTQLKLLQNVIKTFEPTDEPIGKIIRSVLKKELKIDPKTLAVLFAADRREHLNNLLYPQCAKNNIVVSDRYFLSSYVYQGLTCEYDFVYNLNKDFPFPEIIFFLNIHPEDAIKRIQSRGQEKELFEELDFQLKVYTKYLEFLVVCEREGSRVINIDGNQSIESIHLQIQEKIPIQGDFL